MLGRTYGIEAEVEDFENENQVFYPTVEDEFEHTHKNDQKIFLGKDKRYKYRAEVREDGDEAPAALHEPTPEEWYAGIL